MIQISGVAQRTFSFPAGLQEAFHFYADLPRALSFLIHISIVKRYPDGQYRLLYCAPEGGIYRVNIYCDVMAEVDERACAIRIHPSNGQKPVRAEAGLYSMTCQGYYSSEIFFRQGKVQTDVDCQIILRASLPTAITLRLIPSAVVNANAQADLRRRVDEILAAFIERSISMYSRFPDH